MHYKDKRPDHELTVFTKTQELISHTFNITEKFPKKERFTLTQRMQNITLDIYEYLLQANEVYINTKLMQDMEKSIKHIEMETKKEVFSEYKLLTLRLAYATKFDEKIQERRGLQTKALSGVKTLMYFTRLSLERKHISFGQYENWSLLLNDCKNLTAAWIKADKKRFTGE